MTRRAFERGRWWIVAIALGLFQPGVYAAELIEQITVTATKREQSLQDVGIAVTAFTGEQIEQLGFTNSIDIVAQTPGMTFGTPTAEGNNANLSLRGVALNDFNDNNESPVAVYVDEVYVSAIAGATFQLFDLERVEVLRGPQGTLFGRNTSGGLAHFITKKPQTESIEGYVDVTVGEESLIKTEGALNVPLGERAAVRASVAQNKFDGYVKNREPGIDDPNDADSIAGRLQLLVEATDSVDLLFNIHYSEEDSLDGSWQHQATTLGGDALDISIPLPADELTLANCDGEGGGQVGPGLDCFGYRDDDGDPWAGDYDRDGPLTIKNKGGSLRLDWAINESMTLTSLTGYEKYERLFGEDTDLGPFPGIVPTFDSEVEQYTQEIRLAGSTDRMRWVGGLFYFDSEVDGIIDVGAVTLNDPPVEPACRVGACLPPSSNFLIYFDAMYEQDTTSWAAFGQVDFDLTESLTLIAGLRYTDEERDMEYFAQDLAGFLSENEINADDIYFDFTKATVGDLTENDSDNWTGKVELDWRLNDDLMLYGFVARGVKSAGFNSGLLDENGIFNTVALEQVPFDEETITDYEVGLKSTLWDGRARLNLSAFYYDYEDFQAFQFANLGQLIFNTDATIWGGEAELWVTPTDRIDAIFGIGWIGEAEAEDIASPAGNIRDRDMVLAPEWQLNTVLRYTQPIGAHSLAFQVDGFYQTEQYFDIQNHPVSESDDYTVWNARISYMSPDERWTVTAWMNNVFDEEYLVYTFDFTASFGFNQLGYGRPQWSGLTVNYRF